MSESRERRQDRREEERARKYDEKRTSLPSARKRFGNWRPGTRWRGRRRLGTGLIVGFMSAVLGVFVVGMVLSFVELIWGNGDVLGIEDSCGAGTACSLFSWGFFALVPIAAAVLWVLIYRLALVRRKYRKYAQEHPDELLDTELLSPMIVGRDDLCDVLQKDLESRWEDRDEQDATGKPGAATRLGRRVQRLWGRAEHRRPIVLVGGVGLGKTAVLARLTQLLAERGAVPIPIRLRAAQADGELDFMKLAREKFMSVAAVLSDAEADKIWRRLHDNDQLVIVADGLEEALTSVKDTRETAIRSAFERIRRDNVALIVSSRPHGALRHLDAAMVNLEPLEVRAALEYVIGDEAIRRGPSKREIRIVECAELAEMPLFMHIARELNDADGLKDVDARGVDRLGMRVRLMERWIELLTEGKIKPAVPLKPARRQEVIGQLEGIAAFGLMNDSLEVTFEDFTKRKDPADEANGTVPDGNEVKDTLDATTQDLREVAADAERLDLVDARPEGVRFRHSVTQSYLGSRRISEGLRAHGTKRGKFDDLSNQLERSLAHPGRELLMALAMSCSAHDERARTRAIRLLLRNIDDSEQKEKAVYTASAVIAAASASTKRVSADQNGSTKALNVSPYTRRSEFRSRVITWLARAEAEDAEREAERAQADRVITRKHLREAQSDVDKAELKLVDCMQKAEEAEEAQARSTVEVAAPPARAAAVKVIEKRKTVAARARGEAAAELGTARVKAAEMQRKHALAHAEAAVAGVILAEKKLAEAEPEYGATDLNELRRAASDSIRRAITDADEARKERAGAMDAEAEAYAVSAQAVGDEAAAMKAIARLAEHIAADALVASFLLAEALEAEKAAKTDGEAKADEAADAEEAAKKALLTRATELLASAIDAAGKSEAMRDVAIALDAASDDPRVEAEGIRRAPRWKKERLAEGRDPHQGEAHATPGDRRPRSQDDRTKVRALQAQLEAAALTVVRAYEAVDELGEGRIAEAGACLEDLSMTIGKATAGDWGEFVRAIRLVGRAAAKAIHVGHALEAGYYVNADQDADVDVETQGRLRERIISSLHAVSHDVEESKLTGGRDGLPPDKRRATSRTQVLVPLTDRMPTKDADTDEGVQTAKLDAIARLYDAAQFVWLWKVCKTEPDSFVRMSAARKLAGGGLAAFAHVRQELATIMEAAQQQRSSKATDSTRKLRKIGVRPDRAFELMGWLLPLFYVSIERDAPRETTSEPEPGPDHRTLLKQWIPLSNTFVRSEMALAEGMRFAANQRDLPAGQQSFLTARAEKLIGDTKFWFSKVALLQALTLWLLSHEEHDGRSDTSSDEAEEKIAEYCKHAGHPFVNEASALCIKALRRRQPANYIWLDERAATAKLGAGRDLVRVASTQKTHWIPATAGWLSLAPRAQQLLGDMVVFLNLLDRGDDTPTREECLKRSFPAEGEEVRGLPPCLSARGGRRHLDVGRKLDKPVEPSARCEARCELRLCPYPGLGEDLSRGELSEAFCRRQYSLVARRSSKRPPWQREATFDELRQFWRAMERRPRA